MSSRKSNVKVKATLIENKNSVRNSVVLDKDTQLRFTFAQFQLKPINIKGKFNNYFSDYKHYIEKISALIGKGLPLLSREKISLFTKEYNKADALHLHKISDKQELITRILLQYGVPEKSIEEVLYGDELYQLEVPYANGAMRIIFHRIENLISFLFLDTNHHIYLNAIKVEQSGSLFYDYCPTYADGVCSIMSDIKTCYAFEFLDEKKLTASYSYEYTPFDRE